MASEEYHIDHTRCLPFTSSYVYRLLLNVSTYFATPELDEYGVRVTNDWSLPRWKATKECSKHSHAYQLNNGLVEGFRSHHI